MLTFFLGAPPLLCAALTSRAGRTNTHLYDLSLSGSFDLSLNELGQATKFLVFGRLSG